MTFVSQILRSLQCCIWSGVHVDRRNQSRRRIQRLASTEQFEARMLLAAAFADHRVIVSLQHDSDQAAVVKSIPGSNLEPLGDYGLYIVNLPGSYKPLQAVNRLGTVPGVNFVEPDWVITPEAIPNDPQFSTQWGLQNVGQTVGGNAGTAGADTHATTAWDTITGSRNVIVAINDTGVDFLHEDLAANMWVNLGEIAGNGVDDDGNGYIDDVNGYDFGDDDSDPSPDAGQGNDHGTHVAGIVGAVGNNAVGISGVNWNVQLMAVKIFPSGNNSFISAAVAGLNYAVDNGAFVSNHSYNTGTGGPIQAYQAAVVYAQSNGHVFVSSAGNTAQDNDIINHYPSDYPFDNVVAVAATDNNDQIASFSNIGLTTVDLGAPGVDVLSTLPGDNYGLNSGTSMASPHVAGAVALLKSLRADLNYQDILGAIYRGVDPLSTLQGVTVTGGRLNLDRAIQELPPYVNPDPTPGTPMMVFPQGTIGQATPMFVWTTASDATEYELEVDNLSGNKPAFYTRTLDTTSHLADFQFGEGDYQARVRAFSATGKVSEWSEYLSFTINIPTPASPVMISPQGNIGNSFPKFEWTSVNNGQMYSLWVTNLATQKRVIYRTSYTSNTYTHFNPLPDGNYRAWVRAFNTVGEYSAWSKPVDFTIDAPVPVKSTLTAPERTVTTSTPRFTWKKIAGVAYYDLWVNNLSTGESQFLRRPTISRNSTGLTAPSFPQGNYVAWLRGVNGNNEVGPWSNARSFEVDILPPTTPRLTGPRGPNGSLTINTINPLFRWTTATRAVTYDLWVNNVTTGAAQIVRKVNLSTNRYRSFQDLPQGDYKAWVRGINEAGEAGEWSAPFSFAIDEPTPLRPTITAPVPNPAGSVENANPTIKWTSNVKAPYYELQIDNVSLNRKNVIAVTDIRKENYTIPNDQRFGEYTYLARVRAYNTSGETSRWSPAYRFRIDVPDPTTPVIIGPGGTSNDTTPRFSWVHSGSSYRYEILIRDLLRNENIVLNVTAFQVNPQGTEAYYVLPNDQALLPGTYRFWIRAFNSLGQSSQWSSSKTFVISASLDPDLLKEATLFDEATTVVLTAIPSARTQVSSTAVPESQVLDITVESQATDFAEPIRSDWPEVPLNSQPVDSEEVALIDAAILLWSDPALQIDLPDSTGQRS